MAIVPVAVFEGMSGEDNSSVCQTAQRLYSHRDSLCSGKVEAVVYTFPTTALHKTLDLNIRFKDESVLNCLLRCSSK